MKKLYSIAMIAACAMMVFSCKNNGKGNEEVPAPADEAIEAVENAAENAADAVKDGAQAIENAAEDAAKAAGEALDKLDDIVPYTAVEVKPTFNGGDANDFSKYIQQNIKYPQSAIENNESGRVTVNFVVDANGKIKNAKVVKGVSEALDAEALRVIESAPDWTPAKQGGVNVPVTYSMPVVFALR
ncbi:MAG: energy transducer TonB [Bacteroidales bacterium]|nr:energy transducer TonB [Bacteroidales bacterium]